MTDRPVEREQRVLQAYDRVLDVPAAERIEFIRRHFAADPALARDLEGLLEAGDRAESGLLAEPVDAVARPVLADLADRAAVLDVAFHTEVRSAVAPRYRLEGEIGNGGMAVVYLAFDNKLGRPVAIKALRPELADGLTLERFEREVAIAARLKHPRIVHVYDRGGPAGVLYYVMQHVGGGSMRDRCPAGRRLDIPETISIARQVAEALDYAHAQGVVHRDIKPENILLDANGAYVADFGVARLLDAVGREHLTRTGTAIGTALYMSPEQTEPSSDLDGRSDVYSLTCVIYEMLAGDPPYTAATQRGVLLKHMVAEIPDLCAVRPEVTRQMQQVIAAGLAKSPADRPATAGELLDRLERAYLASGRETTGDRASAARPRTIAVLPFENMSGDPSNEYFSDGITEELIGALTRAGGMRVVARTSCFAFKDKHRDIREIGVALGATHVLEGAVRMAGRRLRASAQLVDAVSGSQLWSERYDRDVEDVFAVQDDITNAIVVRLRRDLEPPFSLDDRRLPPPAAPPVAAREGPAGSDSETGVFTMARGDEPARTAGSEIEALPGAPRPSEVQPGPAPAASATLLTEAARGRYEVLEELGRGGIGVVYLAVDRMTNQKVAIKMLRPEFASHERTRARLIREAQVVGRLHHPNIVSIYDVWETPEAVCLIMPFVEGESLGQRLAREGRLPIDEVVRLMRKAASALAYAHAHGVVHRDVKPGNILVDKDGNAVVTDFGLANVAEDSELTATGLVTGTPAYMSPEQCYAGPITAASDQYSLGVVAYEMLTGRVPFEGSPFAVMRANAEKPVPPIRQARPTCPADLEAAVMRMLAKDPAERWPSIQRALDDLAAPTAPQFARPSLASRIASLVSNLWGPKRAARPSERRQRFSAYDAYLRGRFLLRFGGSPTRSAESRAKSLEEAIQQFDEAIEGNREFAPAYAARAYARTMLARAGVSASSDLRRDAKQDAEAALRLAPTLAEAHVANALVAMFFEWDRETALAALDRAIEISPAYAEAHLWRGFELTWLEGQPGPAIKSLERALDLDPLSLVARVELAFAYWMRRDFDEARRQAHKAVEFGKLLGSKPRGPDKSRERPPADGFAAAHHVRAVVLAELDRLDEALTDATEACRVGGRQTMHLAHLGMIHGLRSDSAGARDVIAELQARAGGGAAVSTALATVYRGLRDWGKVLEHLNEAYEARDVNLIFVPFSRHFAELRSDRRFAEWLGKLHGELAPPT